MQKCLVVSKPSDLRDADLYEYRFDRFLFKKEHIRYPCIFTIRSENQGGDFRGSERERELLWRKILVFKPTYIDLEYNAGFTLPGKKLISYHNFEMTPKTFPKADKIACKAHSILDALHILTYAERKKVLGIAMGEHGLITRLFARPWTYIAPQSLTEEEAKLYDPSKPLYGLIGGTVDQSVSELTHNQCGICYIKMAVQTHELQEFFNYAYLFKGLSVTLPLKEAVLPFVVADQEAQEIGAVNTIVIRDKLYGFNTDGHGALDALGSVLNKRIHILGAGGSAKAIAYEAKKRGAAVSIENRERQKAEKLASKWGLSLENHGYDILVNTTPLKPDIGPGKTLFDIRCKPPEYANCQIIHGFQMFKNQAIGQFKLWGLPESSIEKIRELTLDRL